MKFNYNCIDPKIRPIIRKMHKKGIKTKACCAGVGISKDYDGETQSKRHPNYNMSLVNPYVLINSKKSNNKTIKQFIKKCSEYKVYCSYCKCEGDKGQDEFSLFDIDTLDRRRGKIYIGLPSIFWKAFSIHASKKSKKKPLYYRQASKRLYKKKIQWLNKMKEIVDSL